MSGTGVLNPSPGAAKSKREFFRQHVIMTNGSYTIGRDNTDLSAELDWNETDELNVLGEMTSSNVLTAVATDVDTYFVRKDDPFGLFLLDLYSRRADLDEVRVKYGEVMMWIDTTTTPPDVEIIFANTQDAVVLIQSIGGESTDGVNIPFTMKKIGKPTEANYNPTTEAYTPKSP